MASIHDKGVVAIGMDEDGAYTLNDNPESKELLEKVRGSQFTEQQIEEYCAKIVRVYVSPVRESELLREAVQIIRQLQGGAQLPPEPRSCNTGQTEPLK